MLESEAFFRVQGVEKSYDDGTRALSGVDLDVTQGELIVIAGESGSGKSTLLHCMATTEPVSGGEVLYRGADVQAMNSNQQAAWRRDKVGMVYQDDALFGNRTVADNIVLPHKVNRTRIDPNRALWLSHTLGIEGLLSKKPGQMSGGQRQRVSIVRALVHEPEIIFADEPTASLDKVNRYGVYNIFKRISKEMGATVIIVAHDEMATDPRFADRVVTLSDGALSSIDTQG